MNRDVQYSTSPARVWKAARAGSLRIMKSLIRRLARRLRFGQFAKFCLVGASGVGVDMLVLHCLAQSLGWNVSLGKLCSAEAAMLNNFFCLFRDLLGVFHWAG